MFSADDVIYLMRRVRIILMQEAILTLMPSSVCNKATEFVRNITTQVVCTDALVLWPE